MSNSSKEESNSESIPSKINIENTLQESTSNEKIDFDSSPNAEQNLSSISLDFIPRTVTDFTLDSILGNVENIVNSNSTKKINFNFIDEGPSTSKKCEDDLEEIKEHVLKLCDQKKSKTFQLPAEEIAVIEPISKEVAGDDFTKNKRINIECECHPNVAGAAVPIVQSFCNENMLQKERSLTKNTKSQIPILSNKYQTMPRLRTKSDKSNENQKTAMSRLMSLQEKLKATTSFIRQKISHHKVVANDSSSGEVAMAKNVHDFKKSVVHLKDAASKLSSNKSIGSQIDIIQKLYENVLLIKKYADNTKVSQEIDDFGENNPFVEKNCEENSSENNKISIKVVPTRILSKKKQSNTEGENAIQNNAEPEKPIISPCVTDSLDGVFIPSSRAPSAFNFEEETEPDGLAITITLPNDIGSKSANNVDSRLSLCLSGLSSGALRRCPKDLTLRMDFASGKLTLKTGSGNDKKTNNDEKSNDSKDENEGNPFETDTNNEDNENKPKEDQSDIISIKPSTECAFTSQIIPVERLKPLRSSLKALKAADSELFSVVSLPFLVVGGARPSPTATGSCADLEDSTDRQAVPPQCKSMPQVTSNRSVNENQSSNVEFQNQDKKRKGRTGQRRQIQSTTAVLRQ